MRLANIAAALGAVLLMGYDGGKLLDEDQMPAAIARRDAAIELCHARGRGGEFKSVHDYGLCYVAAIRTWLVEVDYADMGVFDGWQAQYMLIADEMDKGLITYKKYVALTNAADQSLSENINAEIRDYDAALAQAMAPMVENSAPQPVYVPVPTPSGPTPPIHCTTIAGPLATNTDCQ